MAVLLTGCSSTTASREGANQARGKELFQQKCGACHVLADAGTAGETGPNLDDGFLARDQGFEESTYFEVVRRQMEIPGPPMPDFDEEGTPNYLSEEDRIAIADYVARVAAKPVERQAEDPRSVFNASCASCHTLQEAGATGSVGPNLDESSLSIDEAAEQIAEGGGGMPAFADRLSEEQIQALAKYIVDAQGTRR